MLQAANSLDDCYRVVLDGGHRIFVIIFILVFLIASTGTGIVAHVKVVRNRTLSRPIALYQLQHSKWLAS